MPKLLSARQLSPLYGQRNPRARVDSSSIEVGNSTKLNILTMEVDVVFKLEIRRIPTPDGVSVGHQFILGAVDITPKVRESNISIRHLVDLGIITFFSEPPDVDQDMICRVENTEDIWTARNGLIDIWQALAREIEYNRRIHLTPPHVAKPRRLQFGVMGLKYFRSFVSPDINPVPSTFLSHKRDDASGALTAQTALPSLFR